MARGRSLTLGLQPFSALTGFVAVLLIFLVIYPLGIMLKRIFVDAGDGAMSAIRTAMAEPGLSQVLVNTTILVLGAGAVALVFGTLFALINDRTDAGMGGVSELMPLVPLFIPTVASTIGWVFLLDPRIGTFNVYARDLLGYIGIEMAEGPINLYSWPGLIFVVAMFQLPFVYLLVSGALRNMDPSLEEAARVSGAGPLRVLGRVTIPAIKPAIGAAAFLNVIIGIAFFSIPFIIGGRADIEVLTVTIIRLMRFSNPTSPDLAVVYGIFVVIVVVAAWLLQRRILSSGRFGTIGGKGTRNVRLELGRIRRVIAKGYILSYLLLVSVVPFVMLIINGLRPFPSGRLDWGSLTLRHFRAVFTTGAEYTGRAFFTSLRLAVIGATLGMLVAAILSVYTQRSKSLLGRMADLATKLPAAVPNLILAVGFILAFAGPPFRLHGTMTILVLAYVVLYLPFATVASSSAASQVGRELPEAAAVSGAGPGRTFLRIQLPLMLPGIMAGWALLFARMVGELTASALLSTTGNPVVGFVILDIYENISSVAAAALAVYAAVATAVSVLIVLYFTRRRGRFGR